MISKEKITQWLIKNCTNKKGEIDLSKLNFDDRNVLLSGITTKGNIYNDDQEANYIYNSLQKANGIDNDWQESKK